MYMGVLGRVQQTVERLRSHEQVIEIGLRIENDELAQAVVDLARTGRRELFTIGIIPAFAEPEASSYEMVLTQHLMPEIAARLNRGSGTPLILSREEVGDGSTSRLEDQELRRLTGLCWSRCDFSRIGTAVRARCDPHGVNAGKVFATEVIGQEPVNGNLLEIALGRVAKPVMPDPSAQEDWFAERILHAGRLRGLESPGPVWRPAMRVAPPAEPQERHDQDGVGPEPV